ncbi:hypothetical protein PACTADRAFT_2156 [Pachysolen tannophilus NRRL Y-2460]|uniref:Trafficking protein particle complex subunit BET3 n=1 Tax=Pachysolen tannophilus NRRL Y-2460 TaxID=669874 RepID=A0A1E4TVU2_PACTA|nr:hypothetical protein PACTADRAFT_2156 [Pachysolen tannophilus NRRL Y-2460]
MSSKSYKSLSDDIWKNRVDKINSEVFTLTYGSIVAQLCRDFTYAEVNTQLEKMGYNIGLRLVEEFFAKTGLGRCTSFKDTSEVISKIGFKMFLNITPTVTNWSGDGKQFSLILDDNPLTDFVELPEDNNAANELWYSNVLCGVLRGCLEMVQLDCDVYFVSDVLRGDPITEMRLKLNKFLKDEVPAGEE